MDPAADAQLERRLLLLAPFGRDAALIRDVLEPAGVQCVTCAGLDELSAELERGAATVLVAEEALTATEPRLAETIARQPAWSDLPVLVLTHQGADSATVAAALRTLGNVTLLERPLRVAALTSTVMTALRARERQYQMRAHLEQLRQADQRKDAFLATLAHELRNPLAPIRNSVSVLRLAGAQASPAVLATLERQLEHITRLVDDLLDVSRVNHGKIQLHKRLVSLAQVIHTATELSRPAIDAAMHELHLSLPEESLLVQADAMRLAQVFSNLLNNAAKFTEPGGRITLAAHCEDDEAVVTVTDNGIGIPRDELARVFELFAQGGLAGERVGSGLGIGLTLARDLARMHNGTLVAASDGPGRGSQFTVRLPIAAPQSNPAEAASGAAPVSGESLRRVLVVDDNRDAADSMGALLDLLGVTVRVAHSGPEALQAIASFSPEMMLIDLAMPEMDGYELARTIRARSEWNGILLVALTGWGQPNDRQRTREAGFAHHLVKPAALGEIQALLVANRTP